MGHCHLVVRLEVAGFHFWPEAPPRVAFLAERHRHVFHVTAKIEVRELDREVEFITFKDRMREFFDAAYGTPCEFDDMSCEQIALMLVNRFDLVECEVSEDGENGAIVHR